jgi:hypothetical protein
MGVKGVEQESIVWIQLAENRAQFQTAVKMVINICVL